MPLIEIRIARGRSDAQKRALLAAVSEATASSLGVDIEKVRAWIHELDPNDYMIAGRTLAERSTDA
jgi:4-oxalocrotonate tautomerase